MAQTDNSKTTEPTDKLLPRLTSFFFNRPKLTAVLWIALLLFGILSYTTFLRREGFPSIDVPVAIVNGTYAATNPSQIDSQVAQPIAKLALENSQVSTVTTSSAGNFFNVVIQYKDGANARALTNQLKQQITDQQTVPAAASIKYEVPYFGATGGDTQQIDIAVSFYQKEGGADSSRLLAKAKQAAAALNAQHIPGVKSVSVKDPFIDIIKPAGQKAMVQQNFDRLSYRDNGHLVDANSVVIAIASKTGTDAITVDKNVQQALTRLDQGGKFSGYNTRISASYAPSIKDNISELQRVLLEGLVIVLLIGSIIIAVRASLITVLSMVTVIALTLGLLYAIGYTLNVITLFALILGLSLIVDDTIIMVEAIDAVRRQDKDRAVIVRKAARKVSRAMLAATLTASLSFAPFLFVGGVLGSFIRAIPVTIISSLLISLLVALIFIPFFARFSLLTGKQLKARKHNQRAAAVEARIARTIAAPMLWAQHSRKRLTSLGLLAIIVGLTFLLTGGLLASKVVFNIFPAAKDSNGLSVGLAYPPGTTIQQAQALAGQADQLTAKVLGDNLVQSSYYGLATAQSATATVDIISYSQRKVTSPQLVAQLQSTFDKTFVGAKATVNQIDLGPPSAAFTVQIKADNRAGALKLANDVAGYMEHSTLTRGSGKTARFIHVAPPNSAVYASSNGQSIVATTASFNGNDTTTLVNLAQTAVKKAFPAAKVQSYGLSADALSFDIGQESQNQDSFKTLALAFPVLLVIIYLVLALEFRSLLQPLLIFMAIPFSVFGVMLGLYLTDNPISFFALLGFFALIGLSIKNTILLTDFANQARRAGKNPVDAAVAALEERFRPLIATSLTAVLSLVPLAITSPFWQGLAVVLIFGLLSSTLLVVTVFPYYYLGAEFLRGKLAPRRLYRRIRG